MTSSINVLTKDSIMLWHEWLGHANLKTLREKNENKIVDDLTISFVPKDQPFCEGCAYGKQHRNSFPKYIA